MGELGTNQEGDEIKMNFTRINMDTWERRDKYEYFTTQEKCEISLTCDVDVTELVGFCKNKGLKFYPVMICVASRVINGDDHFKMGVTEDNELVVYDSVDPCYADFIPESADFNMMSTPYSPEMKAFYQAIRDEMVKNKGIPCPGPKDAGPNIFTISTLPWVNYSSINLHYFNDWAGLAPMIFWGKYAKKDGKLMLPVTIQVRHSVCDGYHASKFFMDMEKAIPKVMDELS